MLGKFSRAVVSPGGRMAFIHLQCGTGEGRALPMAWILSSSILHKHPLGTTTALQGNW